MHVLSLENTVILQAGCFAATTFLALYTTWHRWWRSTHGITLIVISVAFVIILGRITMIDWHILQPAEGKASTGGWVEDQFLILIPVFFVAMCCQLTANRYRRRRKGPSLTSYQMPPSWQTYRPSQGIELALSPEGEWFAVDDNLVIEVRNSDDVGAKLSQWLRDGKLISTNDPLSRETGQHGFTDST